MYAHFFGLREAPFNSTPDPRFYFPSPQHEEALATLLYVATERKGLVVVTGDVGVGKTAMAHTFYKRLQNCLATLKIMLVDACRDDPRPKGRRSTATAPDRRRFNAVFKRPPEGVLLLSSCREGQIALEEDDFGHGVFMHYLLEGFKGQADRDKDGQISLGELSRYAGHETRKALQKGLHVFLFSDHVGLETEVELKQLAAMQGLLLMGPECGTAILNGIPLGFANQVPRGPVGLVSASGTGLQQVTCILAQHGIGVSQAFGVGGRDLHKRINGHSMRAGLQTLAADEDTRVIVLISKSPHSEVAGRLTREAARTGRPCVMAFIGSKFHFNPEDKLHYAVTLEHAALAAGALVYNKPVPAGPQNDLPKRLPSIEAFRAKLQPQQQSIQGLYCGGTLAYEALWLLRRSLGKVASNLDGTFNTADGTSHVVLDLGAEEFTSGRPHPMIDPQLRNRQILSVARQPEVAAVLCDVMLGWGSHSDPASALAAAWKEAKKIALAEGRYMICIASVCGTPEDPQGFDGQCRVLRENDIILADNNAQAVRMAATIIAGRTEAEKPVTVAKGIKLKPGTPDPEYRIVEVPAHLPDLLATGPRVINLGLELFATQLTACGVPVVHADWRPPAGGDTRLASLLERLR